MKKIMKKNLLKQVRFTCSFWQSWIHHVIQQVRPFLYKKSQATLFQLFWTSRKVQSSLQYKNQMQQTINQLEGHQNYKSQLKQTCKSNYLSITILNGLTINKIKSIYERTLQHYQNNPEKAKTSWFQNQLRLFYWILIFQSFLTSVAIKQFVIQLISKNEAQWAKIGLIFLPKNINMLQFQAKKLLGESKQENFRNWSPEQSEILMKILQDKNLINCWSEVAKQFYEHSLKRFYRSSKQCREQWFNHLDNSKRHGQWQQSQDLAILKYVLENGHKWSQICRFHLPHRTEHMVKNRFKSLLLKYKLKNHDNYKEIKYIRRQIRLIQSQQKSVNLQMPQEHILQKLQVRQGCQLKQVGTFETDRMQDFNDNSFPEEMMVNHGSVSISIQEHNQEDEEDQGQNQEQVEQPIIEVNVIESLENMSNIINQSILNPNEQFPINPALNFNSFYFVNLPYLQNSYPYYTIPTMFYNNIIQYNPPTAESPLLPQIEKPQP